MFDNDIWAGSTRYSIYHIKDTKQLDLIKANCQITEATEASQNVFNNIVDIVLGNGCESVVLEHFYIDRDYRDEFSQFYSKVHYPFANKAIRLHFFSQFIAEEAVFNLELYQKYYLGYLVLRPLPQAIVGRTVITPPFYIRPEDIFCLIQDEVHVFGSKLRVIGAPFIMQDQHVGLCAQAAMWMVLYYYYLSLNEIKRCLPAEITSVSTKLETWGRIFPSAGLTVSQIAEGLRSLGLPTIIYLSNQLKQAGETPTSISQKYVASRMPALAIVETPEGKHALTLVGYKPRNLKRSKGPEMERVSPRSYAFYMSEPAEYFYVHDDQKGPYRQLLLKKKDVYGVLVPSVEKMHITAEKASRESIKFITQSNFLMERTLNNPLASEFYRAISRNLVFPITYLIPSNELKRKILLSNLPYRFKQLVLPRPLSRFVWVTEFLDIRTANQGIPSSFGEAVLDSTGVKGNPMFFIIHIPGYLLRRKSKSPYFEPFEIDESLTHTPFLNPSKYFLPE